MNNNEYSLENICEGLKEITECLLDLKKDTARVMIKQVYYKFLTNRSKLDEMYEMLMYMNDDVDELFQKPLNQRIAKSSVLNTLALVDDEIDSANNLIRALIIYLVTNKDIQGLLQEDIPLLLNLTNTLEKLEVKTEDFPFERLCNILISSINELDLEDANFDEVFDIINDKLEIYIANEDDIKLFMKIDE